MYTHNNDNNKYMIYNDNENNKHIYIYIYISTATTRSTPASRGLTCGYATLYDI